MTAGRGRRHAGFAVDGRSARRASGGPMSRCRPKAVTNPALARRACLERVCAAMLFAITLLSAAVAEAAGAPVCSPLPPAPVGSAAEDLARVLQLAGTSPVRPLLFRRWSNLDGGDTCAGERAPPPNEVPHAPFD